MPRKKTAAKPLKKITKSNTTRKTKKAKRTAKRTAAVRRPAASGPAASNNLTPDEARELLQFHSGAHPNVTDPRWANGFLGSLRPYRGLREQNYHEIMACLKVLAPDLVSADVRVRQLIATLWGICHLGRAWGVDAEGMLRSNNLISTEDVARLDLWINQISYATFCLLDGGGEEAAFEGYEGE